MLAANRLAQGRQYVVVCAIHQEPRRVGLLPRLDSQQKFGIQKKLAAVVQQEGIDAVTKREIHARCDKNILEPIGVQVSDAGSPRPKLFNAHPVRNLLEFSITEIMV